MQFRKQHHHQQQQQQQLQQKRQQHVLHGRFNLTARQEYNNINNNNSNNQQNGIEKGSLLNDFTFLMGVFNNQHHIRVYHLIVEQIES